MMVSESRYEQYGMIFFVKVLQMLLYASAKGRIRTLTEPQVKELIEKMSLNEYNFANTSEIQSVGTKIILIVSWL